MCNIKPRETRLIFKDSFHVYKRINKKLQEKIFIAFELHGLSLLFVLAATPLDPSNSHKITQNVSSRQPSISMKWLLEWSMFTKSKQKQQQRFLASVKHYKNHMSQ
jgi:hypothetical protein